MALINFSLPIIPSFVKTEPDKLIDVKLFDGSITQQLLFIPDIKVLVNFAKGDLGIADSIMKKMMIKNFSKIENPQILEQFIKYSGGKLNKPAQNYFKDGKLSIDPSEFTISEIPGNLGGLKALEKSMIQSIFETQKPYIEVIKLVLENLVKIEDIIARVLAISGSSMNPKNNPKALGYRGNSEFSKNVSQLDGLIKSNTNPKTTNDSENSNEDQNTNDPNSNGGSFVTQSIVYSTGDFDPTVDYTYIYQYQKEPEINLNGTFSVPSITGDEHLPKYVVFGIFNSNWEKVDESLIISTTQEAKIDGTISKNINWINRSGKWYGDFEQIKEDVDFKYVKDISGNIVSYQNEGPSIKIGDDTKYIKKKFKKIKDIDSITKYYSNYYLDETKRRASLKGLDGSKIQEITDEISNKVVTPDKFGTSGIQTTIEASLENGFLNFTSNKNTDGLPTGFDKIKFPFKPKKVNYNGKSVWIDPEAKYDMKIIKCDSSININFLDIESDNKKFKKTKILRFVKNTLSIKLKDESEFYYEIENPQLNNSIPAKGRTREISIDNTSGGFFGTTYQSPINGNINIFAPYMQDQYSNGIIFESVGLGVFRLFKIIDGWKIERIYWSINSATREGDIIGFWIGTLPSETDGVGQRTIKVKFPNGTDYYFNRDDGRFLYRSIYSGVSISSIQPNNNQKAQIIIDKSTSERIITQIPANSIRVEDDRFKFGRLISNTQVQNEKLADKNKSFSRDLYGTPVQKKQNIGQIYRFQQTEDDTETYFIVEGVLSSKNNQKLNSNTNVNSQDGDYTLPDLIGAIPVFIEMLIDVYSKLIPEIASLINLISNPAKFVTDIIISKIGDNNGTEPEKFGIFSKQFLDDLKKLSKIGESTNGNLQIENDRNLNKIKKLENFVKRSKLNNYVYITPEGLPRFLLDGVSTIKLFGDAPMLSKLPSISFGLETKLGNLALAGNSLPTLGFNFGNLVDKPSELFSQLTGSSKNLGQSVNNNLNSIQPSDISTNLSNTLGAIGNLSPFKLIFQYFEPTSNSNLSELSGSTRIVEQQVPSNLSNSNFNQVLDIPNEIQTKTKDGNFVYQIVDIQYSTGDKIEGINYKYVYIYESLQKKILEAQRLDESGETSSAIALLEDAQKQDPNNGTLKNLIDELKKKASNSTQPIIKFLLNLVTLPLKVVFGIITHILNLFKSFLNPFELPGKIIDFVSFKWILDFFNVTSKNSIFKILGMKFDMETFLTVYLPGFFSGIQKSFDISKIISMPFFAGKLPTYDRKQFDLFFNLRNGTSPISTPNVPSLPKLPSIPTSLLSNILCFIEDIINSIIDFIWSTIGIGSIIPPPHLNICRDSNQNINTNDLIDLLNGNFKDPSSSEGTSYNFAFNIKTSDGRDIRGLDREELDKWLEENKDLQINFNF